MNPGIVTQHIISLIARQVNDNGLVVWYDPDGAYEAALPALDLPNTVVFSYKGSFLQLRSEIDREGLMDGEEAPRMVVYVPMAQDQTHHALIELESAGVIMQPGQQPPARNTRLALVARNALKGILGEDYAARVEKQTEEGKLNLADLDALVEKGGEAPKGVLSLIFGTNNAQEIALHFLNDDRFDDSVTEKGAKGELFELLRHDFGFDALEDEGLGDIRWRMARYVLMTDLVSGLGQTAPPSLGSAPVAKTSEATGACGELARAWRLRRDLRDSYVLAAHGVERDFNLAALTFEPQAVVNVETFLALEKALLSYAEERLLEGRDVDVLALAESRKAGFWFDAEPKLQARWALVVAIAEVLLEAERVGKTLKKAPLSVTRLIELYALGDEGTSGTATFELPSADPPLCLLDTKHRHMESRWYNYEPYGEDHDSIEKLVIQARKRYGAAGSDLARLFLTHLQENTPDRSVLRQREVFEKYVKPFLDEKKTAYMWVDALRFEMGRELARLLKEDYEVELKPAFAAVPTVTEIGMAALLPGAQGDAKVVAAGSGRLAMEINGTLIKDRRDRVGYLKKNAGVEVYDAKLDNLLPKPSKKFREGIANAHLILVTSQEIDELCEQDNIAQAHKQMDGILNDLLRGVRVLFDQGIERIILAADHGYLFGDELSEDMKVDSPGGDIADLHRRVWVGHGGNADEAFMRVPLDKLGMQGDFDLATPWNFACFKCKGGARAYFHGGLSPQELLVPVMIINPSPKPPVGPPVGITWTLTPGSQKLTTRFFSVQLTGLNSGLFDIAPPRVRVELRAKGIVVSRVVSATYGFEEATGNVELRNEVSDPRRIAPNTITLMITEELDQGSVGLFLLDAATGAELARLDTIEVSIAM